MPLANRQPQGLCGEERGCNGQVLGKRKNKEGRRPSLERTCGCKAGSADHGSSTLVSPSFPASQTSRRTSALSNSPAGKSLPYSPQVQKSHLTFLNTSGCNPQSSPSCFSPGVLCPLAWKCHSAKPIWDGMFTSSLIEHFLPLFPPSPESSLYLPQHRSRCLLSHLACSTSSSSDNQAIFNPQFNSLEEPYLSSTRDKRGQRSDSSEGRVTLNHAVRAKYIQRYVEMQ